MYVYCTCSSLQTAITARNVNVLGIISDVKTANVVLMEAMGLARNVKLLLFHNNKQNVSYPQANAF